MQTAKTSVMSSGNKATAVFTSTVHLADKNEHPIKARHKSPLSPARRNNAPARLLLLGATDSKPNFLQAVH